MLSEQDDDLPDLVDAPVDSREECHRHYKTRIHANFPWSKEPECGQHEYSKQAFRWIHLTGRQQNDALNAVRRLLITPFLFQTFTCPEKWLLWAKRQRVINFDNDAKRLPSGKLSREHYLSLRMMEHGLKKLHSMTEKKAKVHAIMKTMYYIRDAHSSAVDKAISDTKSNENVKILVDAIKSFNDTRDEGDARFVSSMDRIYFIALLCMRQFAEVVHIMTIEARDIALEVQNQFSDHNYYLLTELESYRNQGNELYKQQKFRDAVDIYTEAINKAPFHHLLYSNRCQAFIRLRDYEAALADAYRSIVLKPDWGKGYYKLVTCLNELGYLIEAMEYANEGLQLCCKEDEIVKNLKEILETVENKQKRSKVALNLPRPKCALAETTAQNVKKKKLKAKKKKKNKSSSETGNDKELPCDSDRGDNEDSVKSPEILEHERNHEELNNNETKSADNTIKRLNVRNKCSVKIVDKDTEIMIEFEKWIEKGSVELLKKLFSNACKTYELAIDLMESHKQIKGHNKNDFATLLYSRGLASQQLGFPSEVDNSRQYFTRIINEYKTFSHLCMVYYAEARSNYLLNEFEVAKRKARNAMSMVNKFPMHGFLVWPGTSEKIPESDERVLRTEIRLLLQQCLVPPNPTAVCLYKDCLKEYSRKQIYVADLNFEGYFEIGCDWNCMMAFHLRCWSKYKHHILAVSGDKELLGVHCFTPDCGGVIVCIKKFDENFERKKCLDLSKENRRKIEKHKTSYSGRIPKSELNMKKFKDIQEEKKRKRYNLKNPKEASTLSEDTIKKKSSVSGVDDRDVSQATIYVRANRQRGCRRSVTPVSLHDYCLTLPGYESGLSVQIIDEIIENAKVQGFKFIIPDDVLEETEQFSLSFGDEVVFEEDEKLRLPFIFEYFVRFFTTNGPVDVFDEVFSGQVALLPERCNRIVEKCGGLESFLCASPLFIRVSHFIGIHSQHSYMKELVEDIQRKSVHSVAGAEILDLEYVSEFAREFYDTGALGESDIANITGAYHGNDDLYHIEPMSMKASQNSETSSMYSIDADTNDGKLELSSQNSVETDKSNQTRPTTPMKKVTSVMIKQFPVTKKLLKKLSKSTQTEGRNDPEKAKEAIERLQERLLEMQDESTKLKKTSQTIEDTLTKEINELVEKERTLRQEKDAWKENAEAEVLKYHQLKKQLQLVETKLEQSKAREHSSETNVRSLVQGMQRDREAHLREIVDLRKFSETKDKEITALRKRAMLAEVELLKTKEAYHIGIHIQAKNHCEQGVREFELEISRIASVLPEPVLNQFKLAQNVWLGNVATCDNSVETLKAAYQSIIEQINAGRALADLPSIPDIKPPPPGPNPRLMMVEYQRSGSITLPNGLPMSNGAGDGRRHNGIESILHNASTAVQKPSPALPLPAVTKVQMHTNPSPQVAVQPPIGAELPKAPKKKSFVMLVEKLSKNIPQLTKEQVETCAQIVRNDNNGLTGLSYEEIERRVRAIAVPVLQQRQRITHTSDQRSWKFGNTSAFGLSIVVGEDDEALCPICCDPLREGRISTLECSHKFHFDCINKWMKKQRTCPNCRKFMADTSEFPSLSRATPPGLSGNHF